MPCVKFELAGTRGGVITFAPSRIGMAPFGYPAWMEATTRTT